MARRARISCAAQVFVKNDLQVKAYKYKLRLNAKFQAGCEHALNVCRELYNAALQERRDAWTSGRVSINFHQRCQQLPEIRRQREDVEAVYSQVLQHTLCRLSQTFDAFFRLIREFDAIAVEDLNIKGLAQNHHLAKAISDAAWNAFFLILTSKAADAGRQVVKVSPQFTSQDCARCGHRVRKTLSTREHRCMACGFVAHRDHNAALNIKRRGTPFGDGRWLPREPSTPSL
jgi:IS605 OrfB family transposase